MKSLCRELIWVVESNHGRVVKGAIPNLEEVDDLPGHYLLNPGSRIYNSQPTYEKDWDEWVSQLTRAGG
jgi:hypothetical protein